MLPSRGGYCRTRCKPVAEFNVHKAGGDAKPDSFEAAEPPVQGDWIGRGEPHGLRRRSRASGSEPLKGKTDSPSAKIPSTRGFGNAPLAGGVLPDPV